MMMTNHSVIQQPLTKHILHLKVLIRDPLSQTGGSFIHTFDKPGVYHYYDSSNPSARGTINVGSAVKEGKNMTLLIGGSGGPIQLKHT